MEMTCIRKLFDFGERVLLANEVRIHAYTALVAV